MSITNASIALKLSNLITYWTDHVTEHKEWVAGVAGGGPNSDGKYPITDWYGVIYLIESPAQLEANVSGLVGSASTYSAAALAAQAAAEIAQADSIVQAALADVARQDAETARTGAELAETGAVDAKVVILAQLANLQGINGWAEEWANAAEDTLVSTAAGGNGVDEYSARHWAAKSAADAVQTAADALSATASASAAAASAALADYTWANITATPTTLGGYGITDAYTKLEVDGLTSVAGDVSYSVDGDIPVFVGTTQEFEVGHELFKITGTGVNVFGGITATTGASTFSIGAIEGHIVDHTANTHTVVDVPAGFSNVTPMTATGTIHLYVDELGALTQTLTAPLEEDRRSKLYLGRVVTSGGIILGGAEAPVVLIDANNQLRDLAEGLHAFNIFGNAVKASIATTMALARSAGSTFLMGSNFHNSPDNPNEKSYSAAPTLSFQYGSSVQSPVTAPVVTLIDPTTWDSSGTLLTVGGNKNATVQRVYLFPATGLIGIQYGQEVYATLAKAAEALGSGHDEFIINPIVASNQGILLASVAVRSDATDLTNSAQCLIFRASRFGEATVGAGATSVSSLQDVYNNTVGTKRIDYEDAAGGFLSLFDSSTDALKGSLMLQIHDSAAISVMSVDSTGLVSTLSHGTSANWMAAFNWGDHAAAGYFDLAADNLFTGTTLEWLPSAYIGGTTGLIMSGDATFSGFAPRDVAGTGWLVASALGYSQLDNAWQAYGLFQFLGSIEVGATAETITDTKVALWDRGYANASVRVGTAVTFSTLAASGGSDGDIWYQYV